jgi:hypothetical protein
MKVGFISFGKIYESYLSEEVELHFDCWLLHGCAGAIDFAAQG